MKKLIFKFFIPAILFLIFHVPGWANKTSVEIKAPASVEKGTEVVITINVKHMGNTAGHFTNWVYIKINEKEVKRWEYKKDERPEAGNFTLEYKFVINEKSKIQVKGNCNRHSSTGEKEAVIDIQ